MIANQILTRNYNGTNREVVYVELGEPGGGLVKLYYDRKTGFLLESNSNVNIFKGVSDQSESTQLESTNLW